jgi:hypothetical protein
VVCYFAPTPETGAVSAPVVLGFGKLVYGAIIHVVPTRVRGGVSSVIEVGGGRGVVRGGG